MNTKPENNPYDFQVPSTFAKLMAQQTLRNVEKARRLMVNNFLKSTVLLAGQSERACSLELKNDGEDLTVQFMHSGVTTFTLYSFNQPAEVKEGFEMINKYIETGEPIQWDSMVDKKLQYRKVRHEH